jgi:endoglucanase
VTRAEYPQLVGVVYFDQREVYPWPENFGMPDWRLANRVIR